MSTQPLEPIFVWSGPAPAQTPFVASAAALLRSQITKEAGVAGPLGNLAAMVLLGGAVRQSAFRKSIGRSVLDLPVDEHRTLLDEWCQQVYDLARAARWPRPHIRLLIDRNAPAPRLSHVATNREVDLITQPDPVELRGTGGILRDLADGFADDEYLLVANAAQLLLEPLVRSAATLACSGAEVSLVAHDDGSPSGLALIRCGALRNVGRTGYIDFKEQVLPRIAAEHSVKVSRMPSTSTMPIRALSEYIAAVRSLRLNGPSAAQRGDDPLAEETSSLFAIVERGADVHPTAELYDSVVLNGARVERNAVVVRSLVCRNAVVPAGVTVLNRVISDLTASNWSNRAPRKSWIFQTEQSSEYFA